ncbi:hypothetical protein [Staphylococcus ureilyticus]|uniref:hypothetical protein n=1 Tax=Staphylococcus ureilyticus TaxID=94138 RepID=UPI00387AB7B3
MVKIKQKKTMNLPQLIEHIWANNLRHKWKDSDNTSAYVQVYDDGQLVVDKCTKDSVFTVEVEEEITEDTHLDYLYVLTDAKDVHRCNNFTIKTASMVIGRDDLTFFTLIDNDLVKIYDKGKLVE